MAMHKLKIVAGKVYLDGNRIVGIKKVELCINEGENPSATLKLEIGLDPDMFVDQTCDNTSSNCDQGLKRS